VYQWTEVLEMHLFNALATTNLQYANIDAISKTVTALYQYPAMTPSGALATLGHIRADIWHDGLDFRE
jgi:hypothetical protein